MSDKATNPEQATSKARQPDLKPSSPTTVEAAPLLSNAAALQRTLANPRATSPAALLTLQQTVGNRAVQRLLAQRPSPAGGVVQRYTEANGHRIANDHTMAVATGNNNKDLYATQERIDASNLELRHKRMPVSLNAGAEKGDLVDDQTLLTVTPRFEQLNSMINSLPGDITPRADVTHGVLLPSECEKGAISIIGAFTKTNRSVGNTRVYHDKDHGRARIGELLAQSTANGPRKDLWYADWVTLEEGADKATAAWNSNQYARADMNQMFVELNEPTLRAEFLQNFDLNQANTHYVANYVFSAREKSRALFEKIIRKFDAKMNAIETDIMRTVDTGTAGEQDELVTAANLKDMLVHLFQDQDYDRNVIDQAIALVPEQAQLQQRINELFRLNQAGDKYESKIWYNEQARLQAFATSVLESISKRVAALTVRNTKSLGNGSGLNAEVNPEIGQSYGIVGGNYDFTDAGRWNWHWAAVIMKAADDNVTMEAHRSHRQGNETHNHRWDFKMYGTAANSGQTFHDEWKGDGFGKAPVTVLGVARDNPALDTQATDRSITGLSRLETTAAIACINTLLNFLEPLENIATSREDLILAYQAGVPDLADLPANFVANYLQADLDDLDAAMQDLIGNVGDQVVRKGDANHYAEALRTKARTFYLVALHYQGHKRKQGLW